ncbi:hypothetical protein AA3250_2174 [Gluconobacter albidus NBRC 3250]|nr:hypothetical protein AA3250_2174 [Gluconobacter albidus NBRC 3250]
MSSIEGYGQKCPSKGEVKRFPLRIHAATLNEVDAYGIPAGCRSRNEAIVRLVEAGIKATKKASDQPASNPDASTTTL